MKKILAASSGRSLAEILQSKSFETAIEGLDGEAYGYDYTISLSTFRGPSGGSGTINMSCIGDDQEWMPKIEVTPILSEEDGLVYLDVKLTFPELDSTKFKYFDDISHYLKRWNEVGHFISRMMKWKFNPDTEYED
jgi:hypothetical protein